MPCFPYCYRTHFEADSSMAGDAALVREHVDLLERQLPIEVRLWSDYSRLLPSFTRPTIAACLSTEKYINHLT